VSNPVDVASNIRARVNVKSIEVERVDAQGCRVSDNGTSSLVPGMLLGRIQSVNALWFSCSDFYPNTEIWSP
jgi:hypothetical protein